MGIKPPTSGVMVGQPLQNTDRHLWPLVSDNAHCATMHVTASGAIGIQCGGHVIVMPLEKWHALGRLRCAMEDVLSARQQGPDVGMGKETDDAR